MLHAVSFIKQGQLYLALSAAAQFCGKYPFVAEQKLAFRGQPDHVVLSHGVQPEKQLVIIIAAFHDEGGLTEKRLCTGHSGESDIVNGSKALFL